MERQCEGGFDGVSLDASMFAYGGNLKKCNKDNFWINYQLLANNLDISKDDTKLMLL
uniref:Uncharacterized protein n=1 Tax=Rhizophagus irregularis (strain DAOM 181602 / DAOM 197198 / MUCL 43194) TaxID=747089 RepID=U9U870_RHIID